MIHMLNISLIINLMALTIFDIQQRESIQNQDNQRVMQGYIGSPKNSMTPSIRSTKILFFPEMTKKLEHASDCLNFNQFRQIFQQIFKATIKKTETDLSNRQFSSTEALKYLCQWMEKYGLNSELQIRLLMLEAQILLKESPQQSLNKLNKVKHLVVDTKYEYLLPKIFFLQAKTYQNLTQNQLRYKSLKKSLQYGESYVVQFLKQSNQARLQLADNMIIAYFQMYRYTKSQMPQSYDIIIHSLNKAYKAALKNYGPDHFSTNCLLEVIQQQKKLVNSISKLQNPKPITQISSTQIKKNISIQIIYNWQQQALISVIKKLKKSNSRDKNAFNILERQQKILSESYYPIKMDMNCIKTLKNTPFTEFMEIGANYQINIFEEQLNTLANKHFSSQNNISINHNQLSNDKKVNVSMLKPFCRQQLVKGDTEKISSSSSDDQDILGQQKPMFLNSNFIYYSNIANTSRHYPSTANHSRSKSKEIKSISKN